MGVVAGGGDEVGGFPGAGDFPWPRDGVWAGFVAGFVAGCALGCGCLVVAVAGCGLEPPFETVPLGTVTVG